MRSLVAAAALMFASPALAHEDPAAQAKAAIEATLVDPMSVVYRNLRVTETGVCGEFNAKNSFGGYVGFTRFAWAPGLMGKLGDVRTWPENQLDEEVLVATAWRFEAAGCPEGLERWLTPEKLAAVNAKRAADGWGPVRQGLEPLEK